MAALKFIPREHVLFPVIVFWWSALFRVALSSPQPVKPAAPGQANSAAALNLVYPADLSSSSSQLIGTSAPLETAVPWNETFVPSSTNLTGKPGPVPPPPRQYYYYCNGTQFGEVLNGPSCLQAWATIPLLDRELSFGQRA